MSDFNRICVVKNKNEWVKRARLLQEADDFCLLYQSTYVIVFRFIYGLLSGPQEEVEDLTGETFMRAWRKRRTFQGDNRAALSWLFRIARNLVIDQHRRNRSHPVDNCVISESDFTGWESSDQAWTDVENPGIEDQVTLREQLSTLLTLFQSLPAEQREMIVLRYVVGWPVKQIAQHLEMKENTVSVNLKRILEHLRNQWPQA